MCPNPPLPPSSTSRAVLPLPPALSPLRSPELSGLPAAAGSSFKGGDEHRPLETLKS